MFGSTFTQADFTQADIERALRDQGLAFAPLALQGEATALVVERGGRILGPFLHTGAGSLFWINPALGDPAAFARFLADGEWNLGGERIWISPELQWLVGDRSNFGASFAVPPEYDPGAWQLEALPDGGLRLRMAATLTVRSTVRSLVRGQKSITLERTLRPAPDPLRFTRVPGLLDGVTYAGYEHAVSLSGDEAASPEQAAIPAQAWNVIELHAGGRMIVPCSPHAAVSNYFEPVDAAHYARTAGHALFTITGAQRYKVGLGAAQTFGRLGYFRREGEREGAHASLIVRAFFNNPSSVYNEEPAQHPGARGDSIHIYNDGGSFGGYGELEVQGQAIGGESARSSVHDPMHLWIYEGPTEKVARIAHHLLGYDPLA